MAVEIEVKINQMIAVSMDEIERLHEVIVERIETVDGLARIKCLLKVERAKIDVLREIADFAD